MHTILKTPSLFPGIWGNFFEEPVLSAQNSGRVATNIMETESGLEIQLCIPGFRKEQIQMEVDQKRLLKIEGKTSYLENSPESHVRRNEFSVRDFKKNFRLSEGLNCEEIQASYENGILNILIPKAIKDKEKEARKISLH